MSLRKHFNRTLVALAKTEREREAGRLHEAARTLGSYRANGVLDRSGTLSGGTEAEQIEELLRANCKQRKDVDSVKKNLSKMTSEDDVFEQREQCSTRMSFLAREEAALKKREAKLSSDRVLHLKQLKTFKA